MNQNIKNKKLKTGTNANCQKAATPSMRTSQNNARTLSLQKTFLYVPINATMTITSFQPLSEARALLYRPKSSAEFSTETRGGGHATAWRDKYGRRCVKKISSK